MVTAENSTSNEIKKVDVASRMKGKELRQFMNDIAHDRELDAGKVDKFLAINVNKKEINISDFAITGTSLALHIAALSVLNYYGNTLPTLGQIPPALHAFFQAVHNMTVNNVESMALRDHIPFIFLGISILYPTGRLAFKNMLNILPSKIEKYQKIIKDKVGKGELQYSMNQNHTAAFVGAGDELANLIQEKNEPGSFIQYAHNQVDSNIWKLLKKGANEKEIFKILDNGNFTKAGEVLLMPVKKEDMLLPGKNGHDMNLDEIETMIDILDAYCDKNEIPRKKIIVVGSRDLEQVYGIVTPEGYKAFSKKSLDGLVYDLKEKRSAGIEIVDPTKDIILPEIIKIADGKRIIFRGTEESVERYANTFYDTLNKMGYRATKNEEIFFDYNINDIPTQTTAGSEDICAILDPTAKEALLRKGIPEKNILIVPEMAVNYIDSKINSN
jgi:hypothetical protein